MSKPTKGSRALLESSIKLDRNFIIGAVDPRIFSGFLEHIDRNVYTGIYEPGHPKADEYGFRRDVMALIQEMAMPAMRYPGGNFVSGYRWEDGVGPKPQRPVRKELAWNTIETNEFGTNEFMDWCRVTGIEPMVTVNLGMRGIDAARSFLEYCNHAGGTYWSDLRKAHGWSDQHGVKLWCLGNEMDGPWQLGRLTAAEYGRLARETAKAMKLLDPSIKVIVCGSCDRTLDTYAAWDAEVVDITFDYIDFLANHIYVWKRKPGSKSETKPAPDYLADADEFDEFIEEIVAACDYVAAKRHSSKRIMLSFDEWHSTGKSMEHALAIGCMLISLLNHADRVKIACLSVFVNGAGLIRTEVDGPAWCDPSFFPFVHASRNGRGVVLRQEIDSPCYRTVERKSVAYWRMRNRRIRS